jgi:branched-chain amino acid aminotransferase
MEIPMNFTMEYFEEQLLSLAIDNDYSNSSPSDYRFRNDGGYYLPHTKHGFILIHVVGIEDELYSFPQKEYEVDLFKDFYVTKQLLSSIKNFK